MPTARLTFPCPDCGRTWTHENSEPVPPELFRRFGEGNAVGLSRCAHCGKGIGVYCTATCRNPKCGREFAWLKTSPVGKYRKFCGPCSEEAGKKRRKLNSKKYRAKVKTNR